MNSLIILIFAMSTFMWYLIDKFKKLWANVSWGKYITIAVSTIFAFALTIGFNLDLIYALNLVREVTVMGKIITALVLMSGSSAVAEIMEKIQGPQA